jgi:hypothetical protein
MQVHVQGGAAPVTRPLVSPKNAQITKRTKLIRTSINTHFNQLCNLNQESTISYTHLNCLDHHNFGL